MHSCRFSRLSVLLRRPHTLIPRRACSHRPNEGWKSRLMNMKDKLFGRHLLLTNTAIAAGSLFGGDILCQTFELQVEGRREGHGVDWMRVGRMTLAGVAMAPAFHHWLSFLERRFPGNSRKSVAKKVLTEQCVVPVVLLVFFITMALTRGESWEKFKRDTPKKFFRIWLMEITIWPVAQSINFRYVPFAYRFAFGSFIAFLEDILVSYIFHIDEDLDEDKIE